MSMRTTTTGDGAGLRRVTGWLLVIGAVTFAIAATSPATPALPVAQSKAMAQ